MSEAGSPATELASLRQQNEHLRQQLADAAQALDAFARGEVDAVASRSSVSPVLLAEAQAQLRRNEDLLRAVFNGSLDALLLADDHGRYVDANPAACALFGLTRDDLLGRSLIEFAVPGDDFAVSYRGFREHRRTRGEFPMQRADGTRRILEYSAAANVVVGLHLYSLRDVTERIAAEDALRESRAMLEEAQAIAKIGSWTTGFLPDGTVQWSREAARILGVPGDAPMPLAAFFELVHPEDRERFQRASREAIDSGAVADVEHRILRPDGVVRWVHERGVVERDAHGRPLRFVGSLQDVTERRVAAEAQRTSEALHRIAGRMARLGGWSVEFPEVRITWSDETCTIHDLPPGTVPTLEQAIAAYAPQYQDTIRSSFESCIRDGTPFDLELQIITATGRRVWVRAIGEAERDASGAITRVHGAFQDVDDRRKLEDQFRQAQKMEAIGRLAGGVAHDFNNLLSVIISYAELAIDDLGPDDPVAADISEIRRAGQRAAALTRQLLAFSRQQVREPRVTDLVEIVASMKPMLGRLLGEDVALTVLSPHPVGHVLVDHAQLEQVVMNLAVNARDAMPQGGKLTVEIANVRVAEAYPGRPREVPPGPFVMLAVTDTGEGMTEATRARIFEPFFTTKETGKGTGLGLATVFGIVQQSAGFVSVYSEPGHGTTFKVYLPRTDRLAEAAVSEAPPALLGGSETILLVEDEELVRTVACTILRKYGYHVLDASNGGEAFLISSDFAARIDLLLTDVVMPRLSGRRLAEQLAPRRPEMKVLFVSGYTDDTIIHHGVLESGVAFLQKPFTPQLLLKKVREVLDADQRRGRGPADAT